MRLGISALLMGLYLLVGPERAFAFDCQKGWEAARAAATQSGNAGRVAFLDAMLPIPVVDRDGKHICDVKILADTLKNDFTIYNVASQADGSFNLPNLQQGKLTGFIISEYGPGGPASGETVLQDILIKRSLVLGSSRDIRTDMFNAKDEYIRNSIKDYYEALLLNKEAIQHEESQAEEKKRSIAEQAIKQESNRKADQEQKRLAAIPPIVGMALPSGIKSAISNFMSKKSLYCAFGNGVNSCVKANVICIKSYNLDEANRLDGIFERKGVGIDLIVRNIEDGGHFMAHNVYGLERTKSGWTVVREGGLYDSGDKCEHFKGFDDID